MKRTSATRAECPIARSLDVVGDWWTLLILRDALDGATRFDQFTRHLGIAPNMLTRRLTALQDHGLLTRAKYQDHPPRYEYLTTPRATALLPVLIALEQWGSADQTSAERTVQLVDRTTGRPLEPVLVDRDTGVAIDDLDAGYVAGPAASPASRARYAELAATQRRPEPDSRRTPRRRPVDSPAKRGAQRLRRPQ